MVETIACNACQMASYMLQGSGCMLLGSGCGQCCQCGNSLVLQNLAEVSHAMHDKRAVGRVGAAVEERPTDTNREGPASLISILLPS